MTFTYSASDLGTNAVHEVRFLLSDTVEDGRHLEDEEIQYALTKWRDLKGSVEYVAAVLADAIAARYAGEASYNADGVSVSLGPVGDQYRALAIALRSQHKSLLEGGTPDVGGITPFQQRDPSIKNFAFGTGMHDDISAGPQDYGDVDDVYYGYVEGSIGDYPTEP